VYSPCLINEGVQGEGVSLAILAPNPTWVHYQDRPAAEAEQIESFYGLDYVEGLSKS
jgi:hypothetical protein